MMTAFDAHPGGRTALQMPVLAAGDGSFPGGMEDLNPDTRKLIASLPPASIADLDHALAVAQVAHNYA